MSSTDDDADFEAFTAEREISLRSAGDLDVADMYRELRAHGFGSGHFDCEIFDRGRTSALLEILGYRPKGLTLYPEGGE